MTDEELNAVEHKFFTAWDMHQDGELFPIGKRLFAEVRRLRGLLEQVRQCEGLCPFCSALYGDPHADCPAFTPDGSVR
jgi:hypothetical protein